MKKILNKYFSITKFQQKVYDVVAKIPKGQTMTYKQVAEAIGQPMAYRAVGNALNKNPFVYSELNQKVPKVPCHRVIKSDGFTGGFAKGTKKKVELLKKEQVILNLFV